VRLFLHPSAGKQLFHRRSPNRRRKSNCDDSVVELRELLVFVSKDRDVQLLGGLANLLDARLRRSLPQRTWIDVKPDFDRRVGDYRYPIDELESLL
jgi:hypothetical protein